MVSVEWASGVKKPPPRLAQSYAHHYTTGEKLIRSDVCIRDVCIRDVCIRDVCIRFFLNSL